MGRVKPTQDQKVEFALIRDDRTVQDGEYRNRLGRASMRWAVFEISME